MGRDDGHNKQSGQHGAISIHAPRMGRDTAQAVKEAADAGFQSTRPVWGATSRYVLPEAYQRFQSTRPVWGATETWHGQTTAARNFNPRAPYGARHVPRWRDIRTLTFQSTRPVWGATKSSVERRAVAAISIHAPRMGRDFIACSQISVFMIFQSTRPVWGATGGGAGWLNCRGNFNPRAPYGARLAVKKLMSREERISIHAPRMGRDPGCFCRPCRLRHISIHAPRMGRDPSAI